MRKSLILLLTLFCVSLFSQNEILEFNQEYDAFLKKYVKGNNVDYNAILDSGDISSLVDQVKKISPNDENRKAFLINAYNVWVVKKVVDNYPIASVQQMSGFFDAKDIEVLGNRTSLNLLEKNLLLKEYEDPRLHFTLVCGARDCPPLANFHYNAEELEGQMDAQTKRALNDRTFLKSLGDQISLSEIFNWYKLEFGGSKKNIIEYINAFKTRPISEDASVRYYDYDWGLNDVVTTKSNSNVTNSSNRYVVSAAIPKGKKEIRLFNNLYSQTIEEQGNQNRSTFLTSTFTILFGAFNGVNIGFSTRFRNIKNETGETSPLHVFGNSGLGRKGISAIGPQVRIAPFPKLRNFSIQSTFTFPIGSNLEGNQERNIPFSDWSGYTWNTQFFNDFTLSPYFSLFTELDFFLEDFGPTQESSFNRFSTPATVIFSYFPSPKATVYGLASYSPFWQADYNYFFQYGIGAKYQLSSKFELELLWSDFNNSFLSEADGKAFTYNLGLRLTI